MKSLTIFFIISLTVLTAGRAQIVFENHLKESVYVAFARYVSNESGGFWVTKGWSTVNAGSGMKAFDAINPRDSIGYFVITRISEVPYPGKRQLLVHPTDKFLIRDADRESSLRDHPDYEWRLFRLIRMEPGKTSGVISFKG
jgi:hypothetical protein